MLTKRFSVYSYYFLQPWNQTIADSKDGTIVVSMGTFVNNAKMSESQVSRLGGPLRERHASRLASPQNEWGGQSPSVGRLRDQNRLQGKLNNYVFAQAAAIYGALSQLTNYRIIWNIGAGLKLPGIDVEKAPEHMNITAYLPQNDVLGE